MLARESAESILKRVGLENRISHRASEMSGGEQQRVALARALVLQPAVLLADEPTGNLDRKNSDHIHSLLMELNQEMGMALVVVTHNMELADLVFHSQLVGYQAITVQIIADNHADTQTLNEGS